MTFADSINTCGDLEIQPTNSTQCTMWNNNTSGDKCYISALNHADHNITLSACINLPAGNNQSIIDAAAQLLGDNSTYTCGSFFVAISSMVAFILAFLF